MKITIVGLGKMGNLVLQASREAGVEVVSTIDPYNKEADFSKINADSLKLAEVCICFTQPQSAFKNIQEIAQQGKKIVMATTGWEDKIKEAKEIIKKAKTSMIYSSNFSIGVNIFFQLVSQTAEIINKYEDYDIFGWEMHHNRKLDSPSGTAKTIANLLLEKVQRKNKACYDKLDRKIAKNELHFSSTRAGDIAGIHAVGFDSLYDSIELKTYC